jgi:hypothetical protein
MSGVRTWGVVYILEPAENAFDFKDTIQGHNQNLILAAIRIYENLYNQEHLFTGMKGIKGIEQSQAELWPFCF